MHSPIVTLSVLISTIFSAALAVPTANVGDHGAHIARQTNSSLTNVTGVLLPPPITNVTVPSGNGTVIIGSNGTVTNGTVALAARRAGFIAARQSNTDSVIVTASPTSTSAAVTTNPATSSVCVCF